MEQDLFASNAGFPPCWHEHGLFEADFFKKQAAAFKAEYGNTKPLSGSEHWRYGAFLYWLRQTNDVSLLTKLLEAALADPDPPMAGNVLIAIVSKQKCTAPMLEIAITRVAAEPDYYVTPNQLRSAYEKRSN